VATLENQVNYLKATPFIWVRTKSKPRNARNYSWTTNALTSSWILIKTRWSSCTNFTLNRKTFMSLLSMTLRELLLSKWTKIKCLRRGAVMCSLKVVGLSTNLIWAVRDRELKEEYHSNLWKLKLFTLMRCLRANHNLRSRENKRSKLILRT
jgi:hypothetical protein